MGAWCSRPRARSAKPPSLPAVQNRLALEPMDRSEDSLRRRAGAGDEAAQLELALRLYDRDAAEEGLYWLGQSVKAGHAAAFTELGARLIVGAGAPKAPADGLQLLRLAATNGDSTAARYQAILHASGHVMAQDWVVALHWLRKAADAGDPDATAELALLVGAAVSGANDDGIAKAWLRTPEVELLSDSPRIGMVRDFAPKRLCEWLIAAANEQLQQAGVTDAATGQFAADPARTNRYAQVRLFDYPLPLLFLREQMASVVGQPTANFEVMNVLSYDPGQEYRPHHDYMDPAAKGFRQELAERGQRVATFLVYLNDDFEGGETRFVDLDIEFRGETGDALFFLSTSPDGTIDTRTRHAGLPPKTGSKWLLSQWVRNRPQSFY